MKKQTKNTLKVLSTLALAGGVVLGAPAQKAEAKSYKPEVRYDNGDYFVKTSDPEAVGKKLYFTTDTSNSPKSKTPVSILYNYANYNGEELNISKNLKKGKLGETFTRDTPFSIVDDEIPAIDSKDDEATINKKIDKFTKSAQDGFTTVNKLNGNKETVSDEGKDKTPETVKPTEKKETPTTTPKTTTQTETPKTTQTPTTPEKKVTDNKETPTPKTTQTQEQTKDNKQVTEKKKTTTKPLPKTTAETFGGLALYTFGGLSLLSILAFFGFRKRQKQ